MNKEINIKLNDNAKNETASNNNININRNEKMDNKTNFTDEINHNINKVIKKRTLDINRDIEKTKEKLINKKNNINISLIPVNRNIKPDYLNIKINHITKKPSSNSKRNIFHKENSKRDLFHYQYSNKNSKIKISSREKRENSFSNLNSNFEYDNSNVKNSKIQQDDFFKYLKSIGLGDMYKLCMPNYIDNNVMKNYNNRYKFGNKKGRILSNMNYITNKNNKNETDKDNKNRIVPNKRLVPLGNKII